MANQVILKKSSVAARVPVAGDLAFGELALNYQDGLLYYKKADSTVSTIGAGTGGNAATINYVTPSKGALITKVGTQSIGAAANTAITWTGAVYDTNSFWSSGSNTRITIPAGVTKVKLSASMYGSSATDQTNIIFYKNALPIYSSQPEVDSSGADVPTATTPVLPVVAGDYFTVLVYSQLARTIGETAEGYTNWVSIEVVEGSILNTTVSSTLGLSVLTADVDVTTTAPTSSQALVWNGTKWAPSSLATTSITEGTNLYYTDTRVATKISSTSINALSDVDTVTAAPTTGQSLVWNNANWVPGNSGATTLDALTDVSTTISAPLDGQMLVWNAALSQWVRGYLAPNNVTRNYTGTGSLATFTVTSGVSVDSIIVTENGLVQTPTTDYTVSGTTLTFVTAPALNTKIQIRELGSRILSSSQLPLEYLVVAGGGTGVYLNDGGGGGAGGLRTGTHIQTALNTIYTITVGAAGANSSLVTTGLSIQSAAGGTFGINSGNGGSGAGGSIGSGGFGNTPATTPSQGNNGVTVRAGGGGGAGAAGSSFNGGSGILTSISGTATWYAGGGGGNTGGDYGTNYGGNGGNGGGGFGTGVYNGNPGIGTSTQAGGVNTGGGGGGTASGGSGIVILRYPDTYPAAAATTGSPTITVAGGFRIYKFTGSGSITFNG